MDSPSLGVWEGASGSAPRTGGAKNRGNITPEPLGPELQTLGASLPQEAATQCEMELKVKNKTVKGKKKRATVFLTHLSEFS